MTPTELALNKAAEVFGCTVADIKSRCRQRHISMARQATVVGMRQWGWSLGLCAKVVNRTHATVIHAVKNYEYLSHARTGSAKDDFQRMRHVIDYIAPLGNLELRRASWSDKRRLARTVRQAKSSKRVDSIRVLATELALRLPDSHPLKAGIERLAKSEYLAPTGGVGTTNAAKN